MIEVLWFLFVLALLALIATPAQDMMMMSRSARQA
jgi:hypothetical protein